MSRHRCPSAHPACRAAGREIKVNQVSSLARVHFINPKQSVVRRQCLQGCRIDQWIVVDPAWSLSVVVARGVRVCKVVIHMMCFVATSHVSERVCLRSKKDIGTMTFVRVCGRACNGYCTVVVILTVIYRLLNKLCNI